MGLNTKKRLNSRDTKIKGNKVITTTKSNDKTIKLNFVIRTSEDLNNSRNKAYKLLIP